MERNSLVIVVLLAIGCRTGVPLDKTAQKILDKDDAAAAAFVLSEIPVGSSKENARMFMERIGFRCVDIEDGTFRYRESPAGERIEIPNQDYLQCSRTVSDGFVDRTTSVGFLLTNERVSDVIVSRVFTGP